MKVNPIPEIPQKTLSVTTRRLVQLFLRVYLLLLAPLTYFQRSLIYQPTRCERLQAAQANLSLPLVDISVRANDGLQLNGWISLAGIRRSSDSIDVREVLATRRPIVLYFPGNAGNRTMRATQFDVLSSLNAHMLLVDYRGYGDTPGKPSEADFARDARSVWNHLTTELKVPPHCIIIYGESLGGGVATRLASDLCKAGIEPGGLILQSTFSSLVAVAQNHFPIVPVSLLLVDRYPSDRRITAVTCPVLQIHGQQDSIVPFKIGQRLFDAAPASSSRGIAKQQIVMPNSDHNNIYSWGSDHELLVEGLKNFLEEVHRQPDLDGKPANGITLPTQDSVADSSRMFKIDWTIVGSLLLVMAAVVLWWIFRRTPKNPAV